MMKRFRIALMLLLAAAWAGCGGFIKAKPAAERAIARFHELYNQGKLDDIWTEADPAFRSATAKSKYEEFMNAVSRKLGKVTSTSNANWNVRSYNLKTSVTMIQNTVFANGKGTETFRFAMNGTNAVLLAYNIQSMDLVTK